MKGFWLWLGMSLGSLAIVACQGNGDLRIQALENKVADLEQRLTTLKGERGPQGERGSQGIQGAQGPRGAPGPPGEDLSGELDDLRSDLERLEAAAYGRGGPVRGASNNIGVLRSDLDDLRSDLDDLRSDLDKLRFVLYGSTLVVGYPSDYSEIGTLRNDIRSICLRLNLICRSR